MRVIVVGGGWAGCAAACCAGSLGAQVTVLERTDMLLGTGLVGGIMRNNGRYTAAQEMIAMGAGTLFGITDSHSRHRNIDFPGHAHAWLYDIAATQGAVSRYLNELGVQALYQKRAIAARVENGALRQITCADKSVHSADVFIDATGSAGPVSQCNRYGNGCAMCALRCPSFGGRVSLSALCGVEDQPLLRADGGVGAISGSCKLMKDSLAAPLQRRLEKEGKLVLPLPEALRQQHLALKACQQYALGEYRENLVLLDTGHVKMMTPYMPLDQLRSIPGLENARYEDPYAGGRGNSMRFCSLAPHDEMLRVVALDNLFCAGERVGPFVGHTEAIVSGTLAGYNALRALRGKAPLALPRTLATGEGIAFVSEQMRSQEGRMHRYTFSGSILFNWLKARDLYSTDDRAIAARVRAQGLERVFCAL